MTSKHALSSRLLALTSLTGLTVAACVAPDGQQLDSGTESGLLDSDSGFESGAEDDGNDDGVEPPTEPTLRKLDILLVVDNSGSMGEEQAELAKGLGDLFAVLDDESNDIDWRLGVTTTDNGNPWCGTTSPEAGSLVFSSCLSRIGTFTNQQGDTDVSQIACMNQCALDNGQLGIGPESKPWMERGGLPQGVTAAEFAACVVPQGIDGCGFESQLESLNKTLVRSETDGDASFGFVRPDASLLMVVLTDEADCSFQNQWKSIFETSGNREFWHPDSPNTPTSAICWNAGAGCEPKGDGTYDCSATSYDYFGMPLDPASATYLEDAVLYPVERYSEHFEQLRQAKQGPNPGARVAFNLIAGLGSDQSPHYADSELPGFEASFGIGPGCSSLFDSSVECVADADCLDWGLETCGESGYCLAEQTAIPPVRQLELSDEFRPGMNSSICDGGYGQRLAAMALDAVGLE